VALTPAKPELIPHARGKLEAVDPLPAEMNIESTRDFEKSTCLRKKMWVTRRVQRLVLETVGLSSSSSTARPPRPLSRSQNHHDAHPPCFCSCHRCGRRCQSSSGQHQAWRAGWERRPSRNKGLPLYVKSSKERIRVLILPLPACVNYLKSDRQRPYELAEFLMPGLSPSSLPTACRFSLMPESQTVTR